MKEGASIFLAMGLAAAAHAAPAQEGWAGLSDPTRPQTGYAAEAVETAPGGGPVLQSTFVSPISRRALISGRSYQVGDKLGAAVIADIQPYEVVLKQGGAETRLRLTPKVVKVQDTQKEKK